MGWNDLRDYGWNEDLEAAFRSVAVSEAETETEAEADPEPARAVRQDRLGYFVRTTSGEHRARLSRPLTHARGADRPTVGDWMVVVQQPNEDHLTVRALIPRRSAFVRKKAGAMTREQVVAANVDFVFLVSGLDHDFNPRRLERYVTLAWDSGAQPVVLLNKVDLCDDPDRYVVEARDAAPGVDVHTLSAARDQGLDVVHGYLQPGITGAFLGSSGVGKSTLVNRLAGIELMPTQQVRQDDSHGRHTTSHRQLFRLASGGLVIDTPGMREIQLWAEEDSLEETFTDVMAIAADCRFRDCRHEREPGCAVQAAVESGELRADRLGSYSSLRTELEQLAERQADAGRRAEGGQGDGVNFLTFVSGSPDRWYVPFGSDRRFSRKS